MTHNIVTKIDVLTEPGEIFASAITTDYIELSNYKYLDIVVSSGIGTAADTTVKVLAKAGSDGSASAIVFKKKTTSTSFTSISVDGDTLNVGGTAGSCGSAVYRVDSADLARNGYDRIALSTTAIADSTIPGSIISLGYEPRYT